MLKKLYYIYLLFTILIEINGQLMSGQVDDPKSHPYYVQIFRKKNPFHCGGAILSVTDVVTLPACANRPANVYEIYAGSINYNNGTKHTVKSIAKHPLQYDVSIMVINGKFELSPTVKTIELPGNEYFLPVNKTATIIGFHLKKPQNLMYYNIKIKPNDVCQNKMKKNQEMPLWTFCGEFNISAQICNLDYGSIIIYENLLYGLNKNNNNICGKWNTLNLYNQLTYVCEWQLNRNATQQDKMHENICDAVENGLHDWVIRVYNFDVRICDGFCDDENTICVVIPIDEYNFITTSSCVKNRTYITIANEKYKMKQKTAGSTLLPYLSNSNFDLVIGKVAEPMPYTKQPFTYNALSAFNNYLPRDLILVKSFFLESGRLRFLPSASVVIQRDQCANLLKNRTPFKIIPAYFCISTECANSWYGPPGTCSNMNGSPILDTAGELIGIVIWQEMCKSYKISIALRTAAFIATYHDKNVKVTHF